MDERRRGWLVVPGLAMMSMGRSKAARSELPPCPTLQLTESPWLGVANTGGIRLEHCTGEPIEKTRCALDLRTLGLGKDVQLDLVTGESLSEVVARTPPLQLAVYSKPEQGGTAYALHIRHPVFTGLVFKGERFEFRKGKPLNDGTQLMGKDALLVNGQVPPLDAITLGVFVGGNDSLMLEYPLKGVEARGRVSRAQLDRILNASQFLVFVTYRKQVILQRHYAGAGLKPLVDKLEAHARKVAQMAQDQVCAGSGCFLTTAACATMRRADDGWELQALRRFRDGYLMATAEGRADVQRYYRLAPAIVAAMQLRADADALFKHMYWWRIVPFAVMARLGLHRLVHRLYRGWVAAMEARYLGEAKPPILAPSGG